MPPTLDELREQRNDAATRADEILKRDDVTAVELEQSDELLSQVEDLDKRIQVLEKNDRAQQRLAQPRPEPKLAGPEDIRRLEGAAAYDKAFRSYLRHGRLGMDPVQVRTLMSGFAEFGPEHRALGVGTGAAGGFTVPQGFLTDLVKRMKAFGAVQRVARVITTDSGNDMPFPKLDDTANVGRILAENVALTQTDIAFTTATIKAYMYSSDLILVSYQLLNDSAFNIEGELRDALGERLGRIQNQHFTTGTGTAQPQGLVTGGTVGVTGATGTATTFGAADVAYDNLVNLIHSVDPAYRASGRVRWMMGDTALGVIRRLKDTTNRPLWEPSLQAGVADTLLGYPVEINPDMPAPAANAKSVAFGDFEAGYLVRTVQGVQLVRLDERYADNLQVGFFGFARADGIVRDANAYRLFAHSAT